MQSILCLNFSNAPCPAKEFLFFLAKRRLIRYNIDCFKQALLAQLVRAPSSHGGGPAFESLFEHQSFEEPQGSFFSWKCRKKLH